mmetsp:Transcript_4333/g.13683  ORF Transcript_4333/g.13683 Transcript_4333/m.13683 type:complete len:313 (+) Transcript_4333:1295-2233(+)
MPQAVLPAVLFEEEEVVGDARDAGPEAEAARHVQILDGARRDALPQLPQLLGCRAAPRVERLHRVAHHEDVCLRLVDDEELHLTLGQVLALVEEERVEPAEGVLRQLRVLEVGVVRHKEPLRHHRVPQLDGARRVEGAREAARQPLPPPPLLTALAGPVLDARVVGQLADPGGGVDVGRGEGLEAARLLHPVEPRLVNPKRAELLVALPLFGGARRRAPAHDVLADVVTADSPDVLLDRSAPHLRTAPLAGRRVFGEVDVVLQLRRAVLSRRVRSAAVHRPFRTCRQLVHPLDGVTPSVRVEHGVERVGAAP